MYDGRLVVTTLAGWALFVEGALTVVWLTSLLSTLSVYRGVTLALIAARAAVGALQITSAWWLFDRRLSAPTIASASLLFSAILRLFEIGLRLSPGDLDPSFRWHAVVAYAAYATLMAWWLTRPRRLS